MISSDTDPLLPNSTDESVYQSTDDKSTQQHSDNRSVKQKKQLRYSKLCLGCTSVILAILLLIVIGSCTAHFHNKDAACYSAIPQVSVLTRSDTYSILYSTSTLNCFEKTIGIEVILLHTRNEAASVEIYRTLCESMEMRPFGTGWNEINRNVSTSHPVQVFSQDLSYDKRNYFINGSIKVDMVDINTSLSVSIASVCLFSNNDDFKAFTRPDVDWKKLIKNAECHSIQVKTDDSNSTTFHISEPTFAFVAIASTGNLSFGNVTVTADGFELSSAGESSTEICQLKYGKHPTCNFSLINKERKEVCFIAHEDIQAPGDVYDYSNLIINFSTETNVPFWICLSVLLVHIAICVVMLFCILSAKVIYKRWKTYKCQSVTPAEETPTVNTPTINTSTPTDQLTTSTSANQLTINQTLIERDSEPPSVKIKAPIPETDQQFTPTESLAHGTQTSVEQGSHSRLQTQRCSEESTSNGYSELEAKSSENDSRHMFPDPISDKNREAPWEFVTQ